MNLLVLSIVLCLIVGAAVDTGSVCVVRAVNEAIGGKATQALGLLSTLLAASLVFFVTTTMHWHLQTPPWAWPSALTLLGAVIFALGAVVNGACAMGTITRLCHGDIGYLATVAGAVTITLMVPKTMLAAALPTSAQTAGIEWLAVILLVTLVPMLLRSHISARVSLSFALTGMIAAVLAHLRGDWTWLRVIQRVQQGIPAHWKVVGGIGAILLDATAMALFGGRFQLIRPDTWAMTREAVAARLTATGAVLMPGGTLSDAGGALLPLPICCLVNSFAYPSSPIVSPHMGDIVRGRPAKYACFDPRPCELPPDFRAGYISPWVIQKNEEQRVLAM